MARTATLLTLLAGDRRVLVAITPETRVLGQRQRLSDIAPNDVVRAEGRWAAGDRLLAERIDEVIAAGSLALRRVMVTPTFELIGFGQRNAQPYNGDGAMRRAVLRLSSRENFHRVAVGASVVLIVGLYFDGWWHGTFGRHSFWIPPHLVVYTGVAIMTGAFISRWWRDRADGDALPPGYRVLGVAIALTILAAPVDDFWHRTFGGEAPTSYLAFWSPPHLTGLLSAVAGGLGVLSTLAREDPSRRLYWWMVAQAAAVVGFATFVIIPLEPTGIYRVGGVAGPWFITFFLVGLRLMTLSLLRRPGTVTGVAAVITPLVILLTRASGPANLPPPMPPWVVALPAFAGAMFLDLLARGRPQGMDQPRTLSRWGLGYTILFAGLFYPAANATRGSGWSAVEIAAMIAGATLVAYPAGRAAWWVARWLAGSAGERPLPLATMGAESAR